MKNYVINLDDKYKESMERLAGNILLQNKENKGLEEKVQLEKVTLRRKEQSVTFIFNSFYNGPSEKEEEKATEKNSKSSGSGKKNDRKTKSDDKSDKKAEVGSLYLMGFESGDNTYIFNDCRSDFDKNNKNLIPEKNVKTLDFGSSYAQLGFINDFSREGVYEKITQSQLEGCLSSLNKWDQQEQEWEKKAGKKSRSSDNKLLNNLKLSVTKLVILSMESLRSEEVFEGSNSMIMGETEKFELNGDVWKSVHDWKVNGKKLINNSEGEKKEEEGKEKAFMEARALLGAGGFNNIRAENNVSCGHIPAKQSEQKER